MSVHRALLVAGEMSGDVSDAVCRAIAELLRGDDDEASHVSFEVDEIHLSLRVFDRANAVGLRLWPASEFFAAWVVADPARWRNKTLVELGAGLGLCGLAVASFAAPRRVCLTDSDPVVVRNLAYNAQLNGAKADVADLDWTSFADEDSELLKQSDLSLVAADCVYDPDACPALAAVLRRFARADARIWLVNAIRDRDTWASCLDTFTRHGLALLDDVTLTASTAIDAAPRTLLAPSLWERHKGAALRGDLRLVEVGLRSAPFQ
ncbi:hypothetical protein CTAYLR_007506 [Chrysophaeum taylorii]|uniref:Calmodulin-lysine N-methyltransferase n=1 Tax=Chrysophaeum taylorii TaxID=2483200 RepID=A0AAD7UKR6_9STRA|nr:hypothetical protein CTAYLR_007506 [Chrysophaeum taylorii]